VWSTSCQGTGRPLAQRCGAPGRDKVASRAPPKWGSSSLGQHRETSKSVAGARREVSQHRVYGRRSGGEVSWGRERNLFQPRPVLLRSSDSSSRRVFSTRWWRAWLRTRRKIKVGPGMDLATQMGPLVSDEQQRRVLGYLSRASRGRQGGVGGHKLGDKGYLWNRPCWSTPRRR